MGSINIALDTAKVDTTEVVKSGQPRENLVKIMNELRGMLGGASQSTATITQNTTNFAASSQTITCDQSAATADDVVTIIGVDLTAKASGASTNEFNIGADDDAMATNLAAAINAQATLSKFFEASASSAVVTVTCLVPGELGNYLIASDSTVNSGTPFAFSNSGAFASGTGGSNGTAVTFP